MMTLRDDEMEPGTRIEAAKAAARQRMATTGPGGYAVPGTQGETPGHANSAPHLARCDEPMTLNEAQTRATLVDPQLRAAERQLGHRTQVRFEVPVAGVVAGFGKEGG